MHIFSIRKIFFSFVQMKLPFILKIDSFDIREMYKNVLDSLRHAFAFLFLLLSYTYIRSNTHASCYFYSKKRKSLFLSIVPWILPLVLSLLPSHILPFFFSRHFLQMTAHYIFLAHWYFMYFKYVHKRKTTRKEQQEMMMMKEIFFLNDEV